MKSKTGKSLDEINMQNVMQGNITSEDIKISSETLLRQGEIAHEHGRPQIKRNFERAAELTNVPDELVLKIYEMLRPNRSTKDELLNVAYMLESKYNALKCSAFIKEAVKVYEKRGILKP